jgi:hypothetical protein
LEGDKIKANKQEKLKKRFSKSSRKLQAEIKRRKAI